MGGDPRARLMQMMQRYGGGPGMEMRTMEIRPGDAGYEEFQQDLQRPRGDIYSGLPQGRIDQLNNVRQMFQQNLRQGPGGAYLQQPQRQPDTSLAYGQQGQPPQQPQPQSYRTMGNITPPRPAGRRPRSMGFRQMQGRY
jgi:hypothetical protein